MDHDPGNSPLFGPEKEQKQKVQEEEGSPKKSRKSNGKMKGNGRAIGRTTKKNGKEELDWLREISGLNESRIQLMEEKEAAVAKCQKMEERLKRMKDSGLDERSAVKLRSLMHFFSRMVNYQAHCEADKKKIEKMVSEVQAIMRRDIDYLQ
jgi:hypothetical protein